MRGKITTKVEEIAKFRKRLMRYVDTDGDLAWLSTMYFRDKLPDVNPERITLTLNDLAWDGILDKKRESTPVRAKNGELRWVPMNWYRRKQNGSELGGRN